jgi:predicted nucleotidyltransferase
MQPIITENREKIAELCRTHHVRRLSVFGSAVRDDFDPERSDVDLLVDFASLSELEYAPNYFDFLKNLDELFGRKVDLVSDRYIRNPYFRKAVDQDKVLLYAA